MIRGLVIGTGTPIIKLQAALTTCVELATDERLGQVNGVPVQDQIPVTLEGSGDLMIATQRALCGASESKQQTALAAICTSALFALIQF